MKLLLKIGGEAYFKQSVATTVTPPKGQVMDLKRSSHLLSKWMQEAIEEKLHEGLSVLCASAEGAVESDEELNPVEVDLRITNITETDD